MFAATQSSAFVGRAAGLAQQRRVRATARCAAVTTARNAEWFPGNSAPAHLDGSMPADFGFDPLRLGSKPEDLKWFRQAELVHSRWAMLAVAGILGQEIVRPDVFFYEAATKVDLPFDVLGLVAFQFLTMHFVELLRWRDIKKPGSVDKDPIFAGNALPAHEPGYPGGIFDPMGMGKADLRTAQVKELKNGRLAMLAFIGMIMAAQVTGKGPIANLKDHLADPFNTSIMAKAVILPGSEGIRPSCALAPTASFQGIEIPTPCFLEGLWP